MALALPAGRSRSVKTVTSAAGPGSITITLNGVDWNLNWDSLTDDIKNTVGKLGTSFLAPLSAFKNICSLCSHMMLYHIKEI